MKKFVASLSIMLVVLFTINTSLATGGTIDGDEEIYLFSGGEYQGMTNASDTESDCMFDGIDVPENYTLPEDAPKTGCCIVLLDDPGNWIKINRDIVNVSESLGKTLIVYDGEIIRTSLLDWSEIDTVVPEKITFSNGKTFEIHWFRKYCLEAEQDKETGAWRIWDELNYCVESETGFVMLSEADKLYVSVAKELGVKTNTGYNYMDGKFSFRDEENDIYLEHKYSTDDENGRGIISFYDLVESINTLVYKVTK